MQGGGGGNHTPSHKVILFSLCVFLTSIDTPFPSLPGKYSHSPPICGVTVLGCGQPAPPSTM